MFGNFFRQVCAADALGYETTWIAESHLSTEVQKSHTRPVIPHFQGEVGLNTDIFQLAHQIFARTRQIEVGAAVANILCNGGPIAAAERVAAFASLHGLDPDEHRRLHFGFAAGRFDFMNRAYGIQARDPVEEAAWLALKGQIFREAALCFVRLLRGDTLCAEDLPEPELNRDSFRSEEDWQRVRQAWRDQHGEEAEDTLRFARRQTFESLKVIPQDWRRDLVVPVVGSHDPALQEELNQILPVQVFNLSITLPEVIEATHARMTQVYHPDGGDWQRECMPRTVMVFVDEQEALAHQRAEQALSEYWRALEGTLDPAKVAAASENALIGTPAQIAEQVSYRFHPEDRLMLWFDFHDHDCDRVIRGLEAFANQVVPALPGPEIKFS